MKIPFPRNIQSQSKTIIQDFQEVAIAFFSPHIYPHLFSENIFKQKQIIPKTWKLTKLTKNEPNLLKLPFKNGFQIIVQPHQIIFVSKITKKTVSIKKVILKYLKSFPDISYSKLEISPNRLISLPGLQNNANKFLVENLLNPQGWENFHDFKPNIKIQFFYQLEDQPLILTINDTVIKKPKHYPKSALFFQGNFILSISETSPTNTLNDPEKIINDYYQYINTFNEVVEKVFLSFSEQNK
jgi:hypothetical protein